MKLQVLLVLVFATCAFASHFRYMTVSWTRTTASSTTVTIKVEQAWRGTAFSGPIGTVISPGSMSLGDGQTESVQLTITNRNTNEDWLVGEYTFTHTYPSLGAYDVVLNSCCRIGALKDGNANDGYRVRTSVNLNTPIIESPKLTLSPIVDVYLNQQNTVRIPRVPPATANGLMADRLQFRIVGPGTSGSRLTSSTPPGLTMTTGGVINWTPTATGLYAFQVEADCPDNTPVFTPLDFIFNVVQGSANNPPSIVDSAGNPIFSDSVSVLAGSTVTYTVKAVDPVQTGVDNRVTINSGNVPAGVTIGPCLEGEAGGFSTTNECTKTITIDGTVLTGSTAISLSALDADNAVSSPFGLTIIYTNPVTAADCRGELHFKACTPASDPTSTDCASIYVDVEKLFVRGANGGVNFNLQNTCGGALDNSVTISNAGGPLVQQSSISVVSGTGSAWSSSGCSPAPGLTSPNYNTDLNFVLQPDSANVQAGCFDASAPVNNLDLQLNQNGNSIELTGLGGDNVDAIRVVSGGCNGVFRSFIDGPCSSDACPV